MKKYSILIFVTVIVLIMAAVFVFWGNISQFVKPYSQSLPTQQTQVIPSLTPTPTPTAKPTSGLQISSPCTGVSTPVCGEDGKTYASECLAQYLGVKVAAQGMCKAK